jgi:predicted RNA-binding protein associated with RNAse of E/G family
MKRKYSDRANWRRITEKKYSSIHVDDPWFTGIVTLFQMIVVREPLWKSYNNRNICVADAGYKWMQHYPENAHYVVTSMFDANDRIVQWYIDISKTQGVTDRGIIWFDDLYLDLVILPTGEYFLLDEDELEDARRQGIITDKDYEMAWQEVKKLEQQVKAGSLELLSKTSAYLARFV